MNFSLEPVGVSTDLILRGDWSAAAAQAIKSGAADGLALNYAWGFREQDLNFLVGLPLRRLFILARTIKDLSPIYSLSNLEDLSMQVDSRSRIDLARLPRLRKITAEWIQFADSIHDARGLESVRASSYDNETLHPLQHLDRLTSLELHGRPRLRSIVGLNPDSRLTRLHVSSASRFEDFEELRLPNFERVADLEISGFREAQSARALAHLTSLVSLDLSEGAAIDSVAPLAGLQSLKRLHMYGSTRVEDGDLSPVAELPELTDFRMQARRHYRPSVAAVKNVIDARHAGEA